MGKTERKCYGGLGGIINERRELDTANPFEMAIERAFGEELRGNHEKCCELWSALANVDWYNDGEDIEASYSFRAAGDLCAAFFGADDYLRFYCSGPYATVADWIAVGLAGEGWEYEVDEPEEPAWREYTKTPVSKGGKSMGESE